MNGAPLQLDRASGRLLGVRSVGCVNYDERPIDTDIDLLVIHGISLPPGQYGGGYVEQLFTNSLDPTTHPYFATINDVQVSAHVFITRDGAISQFVPFTKRAWHAGVSSFQGRSGCNDYGIGVELEGCDDEPYAKPQYTVLADLTRLIMRCWPAITLDRVVGHCDISPGRKTDPGPAFDWEGLRRLVSAQDLVE